jgi:hypothetical protein
MVKYEPPLWVLGEPQDADVGPRSATAPHPSDGRVDTLNGGEVPAEDRAIRERAEELCDRIHRRKRRTFEVGAVSSEAEGGREDLLALVADLRRRLDVLEQYVQDLPPDSVDLQVMRSLWARSVAWHWNGEESGTLEAFATELVRRRAVDPAAVLAPYFAAWHQSPRFDSDEVLPPDPM